MKRIKTVYIISHTHTDIGYTDHQSALFRQHSEFIDRAIDLCEATADYPPEAQYRWTCEVASSVERFVRSRPASQVDRFLALNAAGRIAVGAMAYHWTPLLSPAAMVRSLYPAMRLRREYGVHISSAMQCDVDGVSWLWADLLPAIGVTGLTMSINPYRGARPRPWFNAFWWEGPGGGRLLTYNGPHYAYGLHFYGLQSVDDIAETLPEVVQRMEGRDDYPYDFLYAQVTHPALPDNGRPYGALSDIIRDWNESGRTPRLEFTTVDGFLKLLHARYAASSPTLHGDWTDWWADGVASSAFETSLNRTTEALLPALDLLASQANDVDPALIEDAYHNVSLYDEHTWGAFNSIIQPYAPFTRAQWNAKAGFAYDGYALVNELLARAGRQITRGITGKAPEGDVWRQWRGGRDRGATGDASEQRFLVINPLSWSRRIAQPPPPDSGGSAPYHVLEAQFTESYRDAYPQNPGEGHAHTAEGGDAQSLQATLPAFGYAVIAPTGNATPSAAKAMDGVIENRWYRVEIDPRTGGLLRWYDREQGRELAAADGPWRMGQYVYEWVDDPRGREAIFKTDFTRIRYGIPFRDTPFRRRGTMGVTVAPPRMGALASSLEAFLDVPGARSLRIRYSLPHHHKALYIDMVVDKERVTDPESIYVIFPFTLTNPRFHLDLNGVALEPEVEQLPGSCRDWYGVQRWAEVSDSDTSIVLVPVDAPLVQVGGITTGRWAKRLQPDAATLVSWPVQNHWTTNFKASQSGELLFRYRLTSMPAYDPAAASRFAAEQLTPPIIVRAPGASTHVVGQFLTVDPEGVADVQVKRAANGQGLIVRAFNFTGQPQKLTIHSPVAALDSARLCSPIEEDGEELSVVDDSIVISPPPRSLVCARMIFEGEND